MSNIAGHEEKETKQVGRETSATRALLRHTRALLLSRQNNNSIGRSLSLVDDKHAQNCCQFLLFVH